jgi:hypothetical protein
MAHQRYAAGIQSVAALLLVSISSLSQAAPLSYFIEFSGAADRPEVGLFTYDAATSTFSNFLVSWKNTVFDLTGSANAPFVGSACPGTGSSAATGFALMNKALCGGLYDRWFANSFFGTSTSFTFSAQTLTLPEQNAARISANGAGLPGSIGFESAAGDWSLSTPFQAPGGTPYILPGGTVVFPGGGVYVPGRGLVPVNYRINFTGGAGVPDLGFFHYDQSTSTFSNFLVSWRGVLFDLSSAANSPFVGSACPGTTSSPATGFALMNKTLCAGLYNRWFANDFFGSTTSFTFSSQTLALPEQNAARISADGAGIAGSIGFESAAGVWSLTQIAAVPEASTWSQLVAGLLLLGGLALRPRVARRLAERSLSRLQGFSAHPYEGAAAPAGR